MSDFEEVAFNSVWSANLESFSDSRGHLYELFSVRTDTLNPPVAFQPVQSNISVSKKGVLRGIHFSLVPGGQLKWLTCLRGSILDCVVDLRTDSPTFGQSHLVELSSKNPVAFLIGSGIGHAFLALEEDSIVNYLLSSPYDPLFEFGICPTDPALQIEWPEMKFVLSDKDRHAPTLKAVGDLGRLPKLK